MELEQLGRTNLRVSRVGLGCNNFGGRIDLERTRAVVESALDAGINHFDTSDSYGTEHGSERFLGELLEGRRDRIVLATKFGNDVGYDETVPRGSRDYLRRACDESLRRLRTDRIDLYYYHRPDGVTPVAETAGALRELVAEGKILATGCSNFTPELLAEADGAFDVFQTEYSLLERGAETALLPLAREQGVAVVPYFPLANGLLTGKYSRGAPPPEGTRLAGRPERVAEADWDRIEALERFAVARGHSLLELALAALASTPGVQSVIAGATSPAQVEANAAAAGWQLGDDELAELVAL